MVTKRVILFNRASAPLRYARRGLERSMDGSIIV